MVTVVAGNTTGDRVNIEEIVETWHIKLSYPPGHHDVTYGEDIT